MARNPPTPLMQNAVSGDVRGVCLRWRKHFCPRLWALIGCTYSGDHSLTFSKNYFLLFHFADGLNVARNPATPSHAKCCFGRCSWCLSVLNKTLLCMFVGSNELYVLRRSFSESFRTIVFYFFTLPMASTWRITHPPSSCKMLFLAKLVVSICTGRNSSAHVCGL